MVALPSSDEFLSGAVCGSAIDKCGTMNCMEEWNNEK